MGSVVAAKKSSPKIMLLNGYADRETRGMTAMDYIRVLVDALNRSRDDAAANQQPYPPRTFLTHLFYIKYETVLCRGIMISLVIADACVSLGHRRWIARTTPISVDLEAIRTLGIEPVEVLPDAAQAQREPEKPVYDEADLMRCMRLIVR